MHQPQQYTNTMTLDPAARRSALYMEADRMTGLDIFEGTDTQREVVRNERRQNYEDHPTERSG